MYLITRNNNLLQFKLNRSFKINPDFVVHLISCLRHKYWLV